VDDPLDARPVITQEVKICHEDTTLNALSLCDGAALKCLNEGCLQYLLAAARANASVKAGRYLYEVRMIETLNPIEPPKTAAAPPGAPIPRQTLRVGFSTLNSDLVPAMDSTAFAYFDIDGAYSCGGRTGQPSKRLGRGQVIGLLLNLDPLSPNKNTLSLFLDGLRASAPQPIAPEMVGKPLCPHIVFRNVTVQTHFGPEPLAPLSFRCRTLQRGAAADVTVNSGRLSPPNVYEVIMPIGLPGEGVFAWADEFMTKHPQFVELSDRKLVEWAEKSGVSKMEASHSPHHSLDRPEVAFSVSSIDGLPFRQALRFAAALAPRNFLILEAKSNCLKSERRDILSCFIAPCYRKVAAIIVGDPPADFVQRAQLQMLQEKQDELDRIWRAKRAEEAAQVNANTNEEGAPPEGGAGEHPPKAELTEEERKLKFKTQAVQDLTGVAVAQLLRKFELPEAGEGFSEISYLWASEAGAREYVNRWILDRKLTVVAEDIQPSTTFYTELAEWMRQVQSWMILQKQRRALIGEDIPESPDKDIPSLDGPEPEDETLAPDPFAVENVNDIGNGEPLFNKFTYTDWAILALRYELHILLRSFKRDIDDPDRLRMPVQHLEFYYQKYFKKKFSPESYGFESVAAILEMFQDTLSVETQHQLLVSRLPEDDASAAKMEGYLKLAERDRRDRMRRLAAGDATARIMAHRSAAPQIPVMPHAMQAQFMMGQQRHGMAGGYGAPRMAPPPPPPGTAGWQVPAEAHYGMSYAAAGGVPPPPPPPPGGR